MGIRSFVVLSVLFMTLSGGSALAQPFVFEQRLDPPGTVGVSDRFGTPVAVDGTTAVVANLDERVNNQTVGAVHVYTKVGTTWVPQQTLTGSAVGFRFGFSVDVSGDTLAVGIVPFDTNLDGAVQVFVRSGGTWSLQATLTAPTPDLLANDYFGSSVRIRGNQLIVGAQLYETSTQVPRSGAAFVYQRTGSTWDAGTRLLAGDAAADDYFGTSVDVSGDTACVGAPNDDHSGLFNVGSVYVFVRSPSGWAFQQKVVRDTGMAGQDAFGAGCGVDGDTLVAGVGNPFPGRGIAYARANGSWTVQQHLVPSVSTSISVGSVVRLAGDIVAVGGRGATIQQRSATTWSEVSAIQSSSTGDRSIGFDGQTFVQSRSDIRAVFVYGRSGVGPTIPGAPTAFQATVSGTTVGMSWRQGSGGVPTSYTILARLVATGPIVAQLPVGLATSFDVSAPNGTYVVSVHASNTVGTGPESAPVTITVPQPVAPPGAPSGLTATVSGSTVAFAWSPPTGGPVTGYRLVAGVTPGFATPSNTVSLPPAAVWAVSGVAPGTYYIRIHAENAGGVGPPSNEVSLTVAGPTPPGPPTLAPPQVVANTVSLSWTPGSGGAPTAYLLTASAAPGGPPQATVTLTGTSASFPGVDRGTYYVRLVATNAVGTSPASNEVVVVVP